MDLQDFFLTGDDYRYRFGVEAKERFIGLLRERFNAGVTYKGRVLKWDTGIEQKTSELGRFLTGKASKLDFEEPAPSLHRLDDKESRDRILALTASEARRLGIGKSTHHYLRKNAESSKPFTVYAKVRNRLS